MMMVLREGFSISQAGDQIGKEKIVFWLRYLPSGGL